MSKHREKYNQYKTKLISMCNKKMVYFNECESGDFMATISHVRIKFMLIFVSIKSISLNVLYFMAFWLFLYFFINGLVDDVFICGGEMN